MKTIIITLLTITIASAQSILGYTIGEEPNLEGLTQLVGEAYKTDKLFNGEQIQYLILKRNKNKKVHTIAVTTIPKAIEDVYAVYLEWLKGLATKYTYIDAKTDISHWANYKNGIAHINTKFRAENGTLVQISINADREKDQFYVMVFYFNESLSKEQIAEMEF